jgi:hypothetical protein
VGKEAHPIFSLAFVTLKEEIVEDFSAILIADSKQWDAQEGGGALSEATNQVRLIAGIEPQRMDQVRADQSSLEIVE